MKRFDEKEAAEFSKTIFDILKKLFDTVPKVSNLEAEINRAFKNESNALYSNLQLYRKKLERIGNNAEFLKKLKEEIKDYLFFSRADENNEYYEKIYTSCMQNMRTKGLIKPPAYDKGAKGMAVNPPQATERARSVSRRQSPPTAPAAKRPPPPPLYKKPSAK